MAWLEAHQSLATHRKLYALSERLKVSRPTAAGHLMFLWFWALDNAPDGDLTEVPLSVIKDAAAWPKKVDALIEALVATRWIDRNDGQIVLHDWMVYAGRLVERRRTDADRKRSVRGTTVGQSDGQPQERCTDGDRTDQQTNRQTDQPAAAAGARDRETDAELARALTAYENLAGLAPKTVSDKIIARLDGGVPAAWIEAACEEAAAANARSWNYVAAILDHWGKHGFRCDCGAKKPAASADPHAEEHAALARKAAG